MTFELIHGTKKKARARVPQAHELEGLLRESIREARQPAEFRLGQLVHTEKAHAFVIEIFQTGIASFYARTHAENTRRPGGQKRKEHRTCKTLESAIAYARRRAEKRESDADRHPDNATVPLRRKKQPRRYFTTATVAEAMMPLVERAITQDTQAELGRIDASCPVCEKVVSRHGLALHTHLMAHVRKKLITREEKKEIQSRLMIRRGHRAA